MKNKWSLLKELRKNFLQLDPKSTSDYWQSIDALKAYDETFARRIRWKWDAVLRSLLESEIVLPQGSILDFGCGTGVASEALCDLLLDRKLGEIITDHEDIDQADLGGRKLSLTTSENQDRYKPRLGKNNRSFQFLLHDRSSLAMQYSLEKIVQKRREVKLVKNPYEETVATVIASHVLTELDELSYANFIKLLRKSEMFILVDAGIPSVSKRLIAIREAFLEEGWHIVAPCTHSLVCPLKNSESDWCHFHVNPSKDVFTDGFWAEFSSEMGIDLRALSTSYLVMSKKDMGKLQGKRLIGSPKATKFGLRAHFCGESGFTCEDLRMSKSEGKKILKNPFSYFVSP